SHQGAVPHGQSGQKIGLPQGNAGTAKGCNQNDKQQSSLLRAESENQRQQQNRGCHAQAQANRSHSQKDIQIKAAPQYLPQGQNQEAQQEHPATENQPHQIF